MTDDYPEAAAAYPSAPDTSAESSRWAVLAMGPVISVIATVWSSL